MTYTPIQQLPGWAAVQQQARRFLAGHARVARAAGMAEGAHHEVAEHVPVASPAFDLRHAFASNPQRVAQHSHTVCDAQGRMLLHVDYSKAHIDQAALHAMLALVQQQQVPQQCQALFAGDVVNVSEQRAAMHWLLRSPSQDGLPAQLHSQWQEVAEVRSRFLAFAEQVRADDSIHDIVHLGIGGSDLGPQMAVQALHHLACASGKRFHFISNIDGHELASLLPQLQARHTLFIVASKTFSTLETMTNARTVWQWLHAQLALQHADAAAAVARHFVAVTARPDRAQAFGIHTVFTFADWVGGRYSIWSAIGLPLAIAIGAAGFRQFLDGAHAIDQHFAHTPTADNLPLILALLDVWYASALGYEHRCIAPYHAWLQRLPAWLQQLEMESNGKSVTQSGHMVGAHTAGSVWGEPGCNGQHAFFQLLHQGTHIVPVEFIAVRDSHYAQTDHTLNWSQHHHLLLANALAQAQALMLGRSDANPQRICPGNRPSTFIVLPDLSARTLGALLALYEHRVFASAALWGINSFDQFGVELGKELAHHIAPRLSSGDTHGLDASTANLLAHLRQSQ